MTQMGTMVWNRYEWLQGWIDGWMDSDHFGGSDVSAVVVLYVLALLRHPVHQLVGGVLDAAAV